MKYKAFISLLLLASVVLMTGCAGQVDLHEKSEPMQIFYDILYSDNSAIQVDMMIIGNTSYRNLIVEQQIGMVINEVSKEIPKSQLIKRQDIFRDRVEELLCEGLKKDPVRVVILDISHVAATFDKSTYSLK